MVQLQSREIGCERNIPIYLDGGGGRATLWSGGMGIRIGIGIGIVIDII